MFITNFVNNAIDDAVNELLYPNNIIIDYNNDINKIIKVNDSQNKKIKMYKDNNCSTTILNIISKNASASQFGALMESITKQLFNGKDRLNNDHDLLILDKKIELKSARIKNDYIKSNKKIFLYDSIRETFDYEYLMLCNVDFKDLRYYLISKQDFLALNHLWINNKRYKKNNVISIDFNKISRFVDRVYPDTIHKFIDKKKPKNEKKI